MRRCTSFSIRNSQESCNDRSGTKRAGGWCPLYKSSVRPAEGCWSRSACARVCGEDATFGRTRGAVGRSCLASSTSGPILAAVRASRATRGQTPKTLALGMPQHVQEVQAHRRRARFLNRFTCSFSRDDGGQDSLSLPAWPPDGGKNATVRCLRVAVSLVDPRSCKAFTQEVALRGSVRHERIWQTWEW